MSYDAWKTNAPDPGTVETDDRCQSCSAGEGENCTPDCRCAPCLRQQDVFWDAYDRAVRHRMATSWLADMRRAGHFPAHLIAEAERRYARGQSERIPA